MKLFLLQILLILILDNGTFAQTKTESINNSTIAFTIPEKDLIPESVAYDPLKEEFYVGSTRKGKIVKISKNGEVKEFINLKQDGLWMVIGIKIDAERRILWACSSGGDNLEGYKFKDEVEGRPAGIFKYNLETGKLIKKYTEDTPGEIHFFNDLVLDSKGNAYITHMFGDHAIYTIQSGKDELELFLKPPNVAYPNGITLSKNERYLFIAHSEGITRIEIATKEVKELANPNNLKISRRESIDGIYFSDNALISIHPDIKTVQKLVLNEAMDAIVSNISLEVNHPMMNNPTTGVLVGEELYYIANAQFGSFNQDGSLFPTHKLYEPTILKVNTND